MLRETKMKLEDELTIYKQRYEETNRQLLQQQQEQHVLLSQKQHEIHDLRSELKLKSFEMTTTNLHMEEKIKYLKEMELELSNAKKEMMIHK